MKNLGKKAFEEIRLWIYRNARQIELAIWQYEFENGCKEQVLSALAQYQNDDGGFGNALEPDCWNPGSSPYTTLNAIGILNDINFFDTAHPLMRSIFEFLESGAYSNENGWLFSIPSNNEYPRAPWWTYDPAVNEFEHTGVTAGIVCFLLQFAERKSGLYKKASGLAEKLLLKIREPGNLGDMGLTGYCQLSGTLSKLGLTDQYGAAFLPALLRELVNKAIVRNDSKWVNYGIRPSQFIASPDSPFYAENEDIVQKELDYLIETRPQNNVWGITWNWHENFNKYQEEFAISKNWWKASGAIGKLKFLRNFGRL
ncbi:MAG: hypothetical protein FWD78_09095 [Treponema sp.]|nr:hypothetical protein [Treponema sp.]